MSAMRTDVLQWMEHKDGSGDVLAPPTLTPEVSPMLSQSTCSIEGCDRPPHARAWCHAHYQRWRKHGDTKAGDPVHRSLYGLPPAERFDVQTDKTETCWLWAGSLTNRGYACFRIEDKSVLVHRWSYEHFNGPIPEGMQIDHLCRVRRCVNPDHLEPVTSGENTRRGENGKRMTERAHCPQGHPYDDENTYVIPKLGHRRCRACHRARNKTYRVRAERGHE